LVTFAEYPNPAMQIPYIIFSGSRYKPIWDLQEQVLAHNLALKKQMPDQQPPTVQAFLLGEHCPVFTLGKSGNIANLLLNHDDLMAKGIDYWHINRGGDITYHGPGQITGYPILDLERHKPSAAWFIENMEDAIMDTLRYFGIDSQRINGLTGVWIKGNNQEEDKKICAIGVKLSRWVSIHGFALNVSTDLSYYRYIVPCGINDKGITSMSAELGKTLSPQEVYPVLIESFANRFSVGFYASALPELIHSLSM
jgi:lipoyl(octanoyl) transferase